MDIIESVEDVKKLYNISSNKKTTKSKSRKADYGFEVFLDTSMTAIVSQTPSKLLLRD